MGFGGNALIVAGVLTVAACAREQPQLVLVQTDAEAKPKKDHHAHPSAVAPHQGSQSSSVKHQHRRAGVHHGKPARFVRQPPAAATLVVGGAGVRLPASPLGAQATAAAVASAAGTTTVGATAVAQAAAKSAVAAAEAAAAGALADPAQPTTTAVAAPLQTTAAPTVASIADPISNPPEAAATSGATEATPTVPPALAGDPPPNLPPVPAGQPAHQMFQCASNTAPGEEACAECGMTTSCACEGYVRFGYPPSWSNWFPVSGVTQCSSDVFGVDPLPGKGKVCMCYGSGSNVPITMAAPLSGVGLPIFAVAVVALAVSLSLTVAHGFNTFNNLSHGSCEMALQAGAPAVHIAPMICAIFVAVGMRAARVPPETASLIAVKHIQGGHSSPTIYGHWAAVNPAGGEEDPLAAFPGMKLSVCVVAAAFVTQVLFRLYAEHLIIQGGVGQRAGLQEHWLRVKFWSRVHNCSVMAMYGGIVAIVGGILTMPGLRTMLPSIACTVALAVCYFTAYALLHILVTIPKPFGAAAMKLSVLNLNFAPMICTMILALQVSADAKGAEVPDDVEIYMFVCVATVICQVLLGLATPFLFGAELECVGPQGEEDLVIRNQDGVLATSIMRWVVMVAMYVGIWEVCFAMWFFNAEPPRERFLCFLAAVYFLMYLLLWVALTARQIWKGGFQHAIRVFTEGKEMVSFCPMLAALVLAWWVY